MILSTTDRKSFCLTKSIFSDVIAILGDDVPTLSKEQKYAAKFRSRKEFHEDAVRSGWCPATITTEENIDPQWDGGQVMDNESNN